ncbi:hypothetical protein C8Q80DRAFT_1186776 [Daedaleopsis nitida]|nr:hypothetical protein C8Q80DRAFT_1186776 [Daedaleopsis nitida]
MVSPPALNVILYGFLSCNAVGGVLGAAHTPTIEDIRARYPDYPIGLKIFYSRHSDCDPRRKRHLQVHRRHSTSKDISQSLGAWR